MTAELGTLAGALAKAQTEFAPVNRSKTVTVKTKTGGEYKFAYAPLDTILAAVREPLSKNGLVIVQMLDEGALVTTLLHESGASIGGRVDLPATTDIQGFGSAITYLRRYAIQALLGIAAEEDDDGNRAAGNTATFGGGKEKAANGAAPPHIEPNVETEELVGDIKRAGTVRPGSANGYKLEPRQGPNGHVIGFRLEIDGDKAIPQVVVEGPPGEALFLATSQNPETLVGHHISVKGRLYHVKRPGKASHYRLHVSEWATTDYKFPAEDEPALPEPPDDVPLIAEAPTAPLFDDVAVA